MLKLETMVQIPEATHGAVTSTDQKKERFFRAQAVVTKGTWVSSMDLPGLQNSGGVSSGAATAGTAHPQVLQPIGTLFHHPPPAHLKVLASATKSHQTSPNLTKPTHQNQASTVAITAIRNTPLITKPLSGNQVRRFQLTVLQIASTRSIACIFIG